ncbi:hypothetical protein [Streptococcus sp. Marseille-P8640]|uniref:hypothetical protein n=1 Tax=Streptococcus sp. Marseille-P8640 TaxID=2866596 RepID=UPI0023B9FF53|nr:hypothetical protein [Streptococcus sp. Marseille-P8640]
MTFVEHNNRQKANKFAEYVTGKSLREYLANKVRQYCGEDCKKFFSSKDKLDYDCVFQNGICSECLVKRVERGIEW